MALTRLVRKRRIQRVARGLFCRAVGGDCTFTVLQVATKKAAAFGREITPMTNPRPVRAANKSRPDQEANEKNVVAFAITGRSSSFKFGEITIQFVGSAMRKVALGRRPAEMMIREYWDKGKDHCLETLEKVFPEVVLNADGRNGRWQVLDSYRLLTEWFNDQLAPVRVKAWRPAAKRPVHGMWLF